MGSPPAIGIRRDVLPLSRATARWDAVVAVADMPPAPVPVDALADLLTPAERSLHDALTAPRRRHTFLLGRLAAKAAVQAWRGDGTAPPPQILPGIFQQPVVVGPHDAPVGVSIAHVDDRALAVAFAEAHPLGIDLERLRPEALESLQHALGPAEWAWAQAADDGPLATATALWGVKEALGKILRCGFTTPLEVLAVETWQRTATDGWAGTFRNFSQYQFHAWRVADEVVSLVLPRNTVLEDAADPRRWHRLLAGPHTAP